jgi:hypothetical protein
MQRRPPKRLVFRKVKRKKPFDWSRILIHHGNAPLETAGCILLRAGEAFRGVGYAATMAAAEIGRTMRRLTEHRLQHRYSFTLPRNEAELAWLRVGERG